MRRAAAGVDTQTNLHVCLWHISRLCVHVRCAAFDPLKLITLRPMTTCQLSCSFLPCRRLGFNLFLSGIAPLIINGTFSEQRGWHVGGGGMLPPVLLPTQTA